MRNSLNSPHHDIIKITLWNPCFKGNLRPIIRREMKLENSGQKPSTMVTKKICKNRHALPSGFFAKSTREHEVRTAGRSLVLCLVYLNVFNFLCIFCYKLCPIEKSRKTYTSKADLKKPLIVKNQKLQSRYS